MDVSSIKTTDEALAMIEKLKAFIKKDLSIIKEFVPFEVYELNGDLRMAVPTEFSDKFSLVGLREGIDGCFSDCPMSLGDWLARATNRNWKKSNKKMGIVSSIVTETISKVPTLRVGREYINSKEEATALITRLNDYVSTFDKRTNALTIADIKAYEIFSYTHCAITQPRMLVPVYGHEDKFILTGRQGDIKLPFSDPRLTAKEWLDFANEHGWKKTNTKFALVDKE